MKERIRFAFDLRLLSVFTRQVSGYLAAASAPALVGAGIAASALLDHYPVFLGQALRYLIGAAIMAALFRKRLAPDKVPTKKAVVAVVLLALVGAVTFSAATIEALRHGTPAGVGVIVGLVPLVLVTAGAIERRRHPRILFALAAVVAVAGAYLVNGTGRLDLSSALFALLAMAADASFSIMSAKLVASIGTLQLAFFTNLFASIMMLSIAFVTEPLAIPSKGELAAIIFIGIFVSFGSFVLWYKGLNEIGVLRAGPFVALIPVGSLIGQDILGIAQVNGLEVLGVLLVAIGLVVATIAPS